MVSTMTDKKNVSFNSITNVRSVPSIKNLSKAERRNSWLTGQDYVAIIKREKELVKKVSQSEELRKSLRDEIGLKSNMDRMERRTRIQCATFSVLMEQERQWDRRERRPERLAKIASNMSQESLTRAQSSAMNVREQLMSTSVSILQGESNYKTIDPPLPPESKSNQRWRVLSKDRRLFAPLRVRSDSMRNILRRSVMSAGE